MNLLEAGAKAPDFSSTDQSGKKVSLKDYRGRKVVLYFYPKDDTPGCTKEACAFRDSYAKFKKLGVEILGVSVDSEKSHKSFAEKYDLPFTLLSRPGQEDRRGLRRVGREGALRQEIHGNAPCDVLD